MILSVGSIIKDDKGNEYRLDDIIGKGGFGFVFKATRKQDNQLFAVKTALPSFSDSKSELAFKNEVESTMKVQGEYVIHYEYVHNGDVFPDYPPYIIMEYANNGTLATLLNRWRSNNELLSIYLQLAEGMKNINQVLVHRDIKPENILICDDALKISDFGLSKIAIESTRSQTFKGFGTLKYYAPEAWNLEKNNIQMDIYAMGIIFYELATLKYPFSLSSQCTPDEIRDAHMYSTFLTPESINANLSPTIASLINRMIEKSIKKRFSKWDDIIKLLNSHTDKTNSIIDQLVSKSIASANNENEAIRKQESIEAKKKKEKDNFFRLIDTQFAETIERPIQVFIDKFNEQYAEDEQIYASYDNRYNKSSHFSFEIKLLRGKAIIIEVERILKENHTRKVYNLYSNFYGMMCGEERERTENYIPQYEGHNIRAWGSIKNSDGLGFNILLVDCDEIYGEWIIMDNHNSFSSLNPDTRKIEPFAFELKDLENQVNNAHVTGMYRSDFNEFDEKKFLEKIQALAFSL